MNDSNIESHKINEIMLKYFNKDDAINILLQCTLKIVIIPRFELISTIDVLSDYMIEKNRRNDEYIKKVNSVKKQAETWIFSSENRNFSKLWTSKEIPEKIQDMYIEVFDLNLVELIEKYIKDFEIFTEEIEERQKKFLRKWMSDGIKQSEKEKEDVDLATRHLKEMEIEKEMDMRKEKDRLYVGGKSIKERQKEEQEMENPQPKDTKTMKNMKKMTQLKFMENTQESKKTDRERFRKIFFAFEKEIGKIPEETKNMIMTLWYGNLHSSDVISDDILSIIKRYSLKFKISSSHINSEVNRLILQTYILGLYMGISVYDIYTIINDVIEANPAISRHKIMPSLIHNGYVPNVEIQSVLNPIIKNLPLNEDQRIIRDNWNKIRFPKIDISDLVKYIKSLDINRETEFKIISLIEDLTHTVVENGLTIEKFAKEIYQIFKKQKGIKIPITEKNIVSLLKYEE